MSYIAAKREDTLNCYFTRLSDFMKISKKLFLIDDFDYFIFWLSKMQDIDNRATFLFLKKNQDKLTDIQMAYVSEYYRRIW